MSLTAKSVILLAKSLRPWADPLPVKTTCRPDDDTSDTHWFTAFADHEDPVPWISAWLVAAAGPAPTKLEPSPTTTAPRTAATRGPLLKNDMLSLPRRFR